MRKSKGVPSYERVNYLLRPKKQIERKISIEIFQELKKKIPKLDEYIYIGMGSIYYYDYILYHKYLGLKKFVSIDDKSTIRRFKFNKPFDFIKFKNVTTTEFLSEHNWKNNVLTWLDYDQQLSDDILNDFAIISQKCSKNDIILITLDVSCPDSVDERKEVIDNFIKYLSPKYQKNKYLSQKYFPYLYQDICINYFNTQCEYRDEKFTKLFAFEYADGANMLTFCGIMSKDSTILSELSHDMIDNSEKIFNIDIPIITYREKYYLDSKIDYLKSKLNVVEKLIKDNKITNIDDERELICKKLKLKVEMSLKDLQGFTKYYKYYPQYYEGII